MNVEATAKPTLSEFLFNTSINKLRSNHRRQSGDQMGTAKSCGGSASSFTGCKEGTNKEKDGRENFSVKLLRMSSMAEPRLAGIGGRSGGGKLNY